MEARPVKDVSAEDLESQFPSIVRALRSEGDLTCTATVPAGTIPLTIIRRLGTGSVGTTFLLQNPIDGQLSAAKITDLGPLSEKKKAYAKSEVECLKQCNHFAIIGHQNSFTSEDGTKLLLMMELADAGDLGRQIKHRARQIGVEGKAPYFKEHEVAFLFLQIVLAVHYMHSKGILHRDIKSANVFLMSVGIVKIGDLGFSQVYKETVSGEVGRTFCGTPYYLAPELWRRHRYSKKADVWSLGVLLYEMACLRRPFTGDSMLKLFDRVMRSKYAPLPEHYSQGLCDVVESMLQFDPRVRASTLDLLKSPYLQHMTPLFERSIQSSEKLSTAMKQAIVATLNRVRAEIASSVLLPAVKPKPQDFTPPLTVIKRGLVRKVSQGGRWKQRYLVFDGRVLTISSVEATVGDTRNLAVEHIQGVFPTAPEDVGGRTGCFNIVLAGDSNMLVHFQTSTTDDAVLWVEALTKGLEDLAVRESEKVYPPVFLSPSDKTTTD
jgi:serine/threonine protein kinase